MQTLSDALFAARLGLRHRQGCYRWTQDGRCVDCHRYTGIPHDVVEYGADGESHYYDARRMGHGLRGERSVDPPHRVPKPAEPVRTAALTPDQLATQEAWRRWRAAQGDPNPDVPRHARSN
jgi:hypothetical protein